MLKITINGEYHEIEKGKTVEQLINQFNLRDDKIAIELNQAILPRSEYKNHMIKENDIFEIITLVGGG